MNGIGAGLVAALLFIVQLTLVQIPQQGINTSVHALQLQFNSDSNQQPVNLCLLGSVLPFLPGFPYHFPPIGS